MNDHGHEQVDGDDIVDSMFGKSPLGLSKSKTREPTGLSNIREKSDSVVRSNVRKKLVIDDGLVENCRSSLGGPSSTADEELLDEHELYGDLFVGQDDPSGQGSAGTGILRLKVSKLMSDVAAKDAIISETDKVIQGLRDAVSRLEKENETLKYNISSLFNTAKLEIERKDREIEENRSEIQRLKKRVGKS